MKRLATASSVVALAGLICGFGPASALELCTTADGTLYIGDPHPPDCVPKRRSVRFNSIARDAPPTEAGEPRSSEARDAPATAAIDDEPPPSEDVQSSREKPRAEEESYDTIESERALAAAKQADLSREQHDQLFKQVSSLRLTPGPRGMEITGAFRNELGRLLTNVRLDFNVLDADGAPIDSAIASTGMLADGQTWTFSVPTPRPDARSVRLVDVTTSD